MSAENQLRKNQVLKKFSKDYLIFSLATVLLLMIGLAIFTYISFEGTKNENSTNLKKAAKDISSTISESFDYTNQINNYIGLQIIDRENRDLKFISKLLKEADRIKHRNSELFSWSSFDWVDARHYQTINSKLGIRKEPPNMSERQYTLLSPKSPWTLQVSFPTLGNPSNTWVIPAATGVVDKNGKYLGSIVVGFDINELNGQIKQRLGDKISFVVLDEKFRIILKSIDIELERDSDFFQKNLDQEHLKYSAGTIEGLSLDRIKLSHYQRIEKYPYIILTGFNEQIFGHQFNSSILPRIIEFICLAIFFLIILYLFEEKIASLLRVEKNLRISLQKTNKDKEKILFSIAHDIKNHILAINGLANIILENKTNSEIPKNEDLKTTAMIADQSGELMEFVKDLLDHNQITAGEFRLKTIKDQQIKFLIQEVVSLLGNFAASNQINIKTNFEDNLPKLRCDEHKIKEILSNLITNAIKYSKVGSDIEVSAKYLADANKILIEILDSGYGMNKKELTKYLSGAGCEIDKSKLLKEKKIESHGIGMQIVLGLIKLHRAEIEVESKKNRGTKVSLFFHPQILEKTKNSVANKNDSQLSILLVDDNLVNIKVMRRILENNGYNVTHAENGKEALEVLDKENFDLILMDCEMPIMNGYETSKIIREGKIFKNFKNHQLIPIIALTANNDQKTLDKVIDSGMTCLTEKAISKTELLKTIKDYLKQ